MNNKKRIFIEKTGKGSYAFTIVPPPSHFMVNKIELTLTLEQLRELRDDLSQIIEPATSPVDKHPTET